ncbi:hypothetical protein TL18_03355 [Methanobrevibacter sp. YE315]|uniref:Ig-like domain-containing protein n=1 Tax=Methanobrevibacter sp. YE315 TaxID=1609968 RepID=UPI000764ED03|nr:Ig-like domain-containing protein [Methanobrevibacter sp. YE315]AMD17140.1 hypothetical protein TL18_03355 [Methanobrevibacter sp. YE315]
MEKNKIIIIALIAVIIALLVGIVAMMPNTNKQDTKLIFEGNSTIAEGDSIKIKLIDNNGAELSNKEVNITVTDETKTSDYHSVVTDEKGVGTLKLDKSAGNYTIAANYGGNENYNGCNATKKITIEGKVVEEQASQQSTQSTQSSSSSSSSKYSIDNLPPSNDPYPETRRYQEGDYVIQEYEDGYASVVDLRTGERTSGGFR